MHHGRINSRASLFHRNIRTFEESYCEHCNEVVETIEHIFILCLNARGVWNRLGVSSRPDSWRHPWLLGTELQLPPSVHHDVILLILWHIWKARNAVIFDHQTSTPRVVLQRVLHDMDPWRCRYKKLSSQWTTSRACIRNCL
ncbi:hypothetical protein HU200_014633 [Digitaria exilis]|uniref:Reverse transcriptase zinc-binding domain-containing protein n=1 Tax=Digitaria exilis TaxID=1010633 RepID=A0A835KLB6_9POAL|nr:hypothetical protein HU200_014633 [Digitaria exilis]